MDFVHASNRDCAAGDGAISTQENAVIPGNRRLGEDDTVDFRLPCNTLRYLTDINGNWHLFARKRFNHELLHLVNAGLRFGKCANLCRNRRCRGTYRNSSNIQTGKLTDKLYAVTINIVTAYLHITSTNPVKRLKSCHQCTDNFVVALLAVEEKIRRISSFGKRQRTYEGNGNIKMLNGIHLRHHFWCRRKLDPLIDVHR